MSARRKFAVGAGIAGHRHKFSESQGGGLEAVRLGMPLVHLTGDRVKLVSRVVLDNALGRVGARAAKRSFEYSACAGLFPKDVQIQRQTSGMVLAQLPTEHKQVAISELVELW